ncbi:MAG: hypothetical protein MZU79_01635 [Anaerotruncus sp.]|nr:hypothetical protein [Anaerotruncus sp.]
MSVVGSVHVLHAARLVLYVRRADVPGTAPPRSVSTCSILGKGWLYYVQAVHNLLVLALVGCLYHQDRARIVPASSAASPGSSRRSDTRRRSSSRSTLFNTVTFGLDYVLYAISVISFVILYFMFRYELFILTPSAHQATFEKALDPILVLDERHDIISWNTRIRRLRKRHRPFRSMPLLASFLPEDIVESVKDNETVPFEHHGKRYIAETFSAHHEARDLNGYIIRFNDMTSYLERIEKLDLRGVATTL